MKALIFDTGPIISLTLNNLLWVLEPLKKQFKGDFFITSAVETELIKRPLASKKFKFEALQVLHYLDKGVIKIYENEHIKEKTLDLLDIANNSFQAYGHNINIVNFAEIEVLVAALELKANAVVIDERTTRALVENPMYMKKRLGKKLHTNITVNKKNVNLFTAFTKGIKVIRSSELATIAFELGFLDKYLTKIENPKKTLLESILWGIKLNGCALSTDEINELSRLIK